MMTVTDGYAYISDVTIYNDQQNWDNVNIRIGDQNAENSDDEWWPSAIINGYWDGIGWGLFSKEIKLPRTWINNGPENGTYYNAIAHELGHYVFGFYDEYDEDGDGPHEDFGNTFMDSNAFYMSYEDLYASEGNPFTAQRDERGMPCWEWFFEQMGKQKVLIDFDEEVRQSDYIPYGAYIEEEGMELSLDINYDFSDESHLNLDTYQEILEFLETNPDLELPNMDITEEMNIVEG